MNILKCAVVLVSDRNFFPSFSVRMVGVTGNSHENKCVFSNYLFSITVAISEVMLY